MNKLPKKSISILMMPGKMTTQLREGILDRTPEVTLTCAVECDEVDVVAGHQGHPEAVKTTDVPADAVG